MSSDLWNLPAKWKFSKHCITRCRKTTIQSFGTSETLRGKVTFKPFKTIFNWLSYGIQDGQNKLVINLIVATNIWYTCLLKFSFSHIFRGEGVVLSLPSLLCPWVHIYQTTRCHPSAQRNQVLDISEIHLCVFNYFGKSSIILHQQSYHTNLGLNTNTISSWGTSCMSYFFAKSTLISFSEVK
jgi:hypothetical protein